MTKATFTTRGTRGLIILPQDVGDDDGTLQTLNAVAALTGDMGRVAALDMADGRILATGALPSEI